MNIDEYMKISHKKYSNSNSNTNEKVKYLKFFITRILLSIILVISISIYTKF